MKSPRRDEDADDAQLLAELGMESASLTDEQLARAFRELDRSGGLGDPRI